MPNALNNFATGLLENPLFQIGQGILANSGPSFRPVNPWRGVNQGLLASAQARAYREEQLRKQMEMQQAQALRQAQMDNYLHGQGIADRSQNLAERRFENELNKPSEWSDPYPMEINGNVVWVQKNRNGQVKAISSGSGVTINNDPTGYKIEPLGEKAAEWGRETASGNFEHPPPGMTQEQAERDGYSPMTKAQIEDEGKSAEQRAAESKRGQRQAENEAALEKGRNIFQAYISAAEAYQSGGLPFGTDAKKAQIARQNLVSWYAKNVLGTPGAEPSPTIQEQAENIIPDFAGPIDSIRFPAAMEEILNAINAALDKDYKPRRADGSPPQGVDPEVWAEMTPQEKAAWD